jgi:hypothetical protein
MTRPRDNHSATLLQDGTVLIAGGESVACNQPGCMFSGTEASAEVFDPSTGGFTPTANMSARRAGHSATALNDGTVLVAGGYLYEGVGQGSCCFISAELYVGATVSGNATSPDGTLVPTTASQIVDSTGAVWTIPSNLLILRNGATALGWQGSKILWKNSTIYVLGMDSNWWHGRAAIG